MDWHKLQHTLFALDPTDPREDLAKLKAAAQGGSRVVEPIKDYVAESAHVPEGSLSLDKDYSVADFAALAGVRLDERQKHADKVRGSEPMPKAKAGRTDHPFKDRLVGEEEIEEGPLDAIKSAAGAAKSGFDAGRDSPGALTRGLNKMGVNSKPGTTPKKDAAPKVKSSVSPAMLNRMLNVDDYTSFQQAIMNIKTGKALNLRQNQAMAQAFRNLMAMDPQETQRVMQMLRRMEATEAQEMPKPRDPSSKTMQNLRKSGAMGAHKDKKKVLPRKEKHKSKQYESIKDMLYRKLAEKK